MDLPDRFTIAEHFLTDRVRDGDGDRIALRLPEGDLTYAEVERHASRFAHALVDAAGVRPEERVLIALPDGADYVGALFGILKVGAVVVMVNPDQPVDRLAGILGYARARAAVVTHDVVGAFEEAMAAAGVRLHLLVVDGEAGDHLAFDPTGTAGAFDAVATHPDDPAIWLFSGGTTGLPKAVVQTHRSFANTTELYARRAVGYRPDDVTISVPKLYFGYATGANLFFPFSVGASAILFPEHPTPEILFDLIARHRATILVNVPSMMTKMLDAAGDIQPDLTSLKFATSAGEALPPALYQRWRDTFDVEVLDGLGTAEMWHIFLTNLPGQVRPGTLGRAVPGFVIDVRDADGTPVPDGEVGSLWVAGDSRAIGYWRNLAKTREVFRGEWVVTGDLVRRDADGYVTYVGRGDDAMKVKGKWLIPAEVEGVLLEHDAVADAVVIGVENSDGLLEPVAFVVATAATTGLEEELQRHCLDRLEAYKHPRRIWVTAEFPRTHLGKVDRRALRQRATTDASRG
jgi:benzoate-CoA ligase family protein